MRRALAAVMHNRNRLPRWVNGAIDYVADHPSGLLGSIAARRWGRPAVDAPLDVSTVAARPVRLLIAPMNYSGQGHLWATCLEEASAEVAAVNMAVDVPGGFSFAAHLVVPVPMYQNSRAWQQAQREALKEFSHVLIEAEEPLFGRLFGRDVDNEARWLEEQGKAVAWMCHGTDIRLPSRHRNATAWSPYRDPALYTARLERLAAKHRALIERSGAPVFVSTPDLLADVPSAIWCPVVVPAGRWQKPRLDRPSGSPLRVVHVPTSRQIKGSDLIAPVVAALHSEGVIEYSEATGIPSAKMPDVYGGADVVLDQFRLGSYGVAACEAMAAGRVVVGHVLPEVRAAVLEATGFEVPVVEATPSTLEVVLRGLAQDPVAALAVAAKGPEFVRAVHGGELSARILLDNWLTRSTAKASEELP